MTRRLFAFCLALAMVVAAPPALDAQSAADRPPNLSGGWVGHYGQLYFNFVHRFDLLSDIDKVVNSPTFVFAGALPGRTLLGLQYASNSRIVQQDFNEFVVFGRFLPVSQRDGGPLDLGIEAAYNEAAESFDAELTVGRELGGILRVMGVGRYLSDAFASGDGKFAVGGGGVLRLGDSPVALAGDVAGLLDAEEIGDRVAWSAGLQIAIPRTPHSVSFHASNVLTSTLHGSSRGVDQTRYGFEFTVPLTLARWFGGGGGAEAAPTATPSAQPAENMVTIDIVDFQFGQNRVEVAPGTTVQWTNRGQVIHTVTFDDGGVDSGDIEPGERWRRTFDEPGTYPYHCTPHPFMTAEVVVRSD